MPLSVMSSTFIPIRMRTLCNYLFIDKHHSLKIIYRTIFDLENTPVNNLTRSECAALIAKLYDIALSVITNDIASAEYQIRDVEMYMHRGERFMKARLIDDVKTGRSIMGTLDAIPMDIRHAIAAYLD